MSADLLTADEREFADMLAEWSAEVGLLDCNISIEMVRSLNEAFARLAPAPAPQSLARILYEAEGLYEKPWDEMSEGERSQYERMAAAAKSAL